MKISLSVFKATPSAVSGRNNELNFPHKTLWWETGKREESARESSVNRDLRPGREISPSKADLNHFTQRTPADRDLVSCNSDSI